MTIRYRARAIGAALALALVPLIQTVIQPAWADDNNSDRSKNQRLIQSFSPYERAMYLKQQGQYADAIEILKPMAALGKGYEQAQLSLGQCYIASAETATPEARHDALVTGTKWVLASADSGFPAAQVQLIHMMLDGGRFKVEPQAAGMWYLIWKRNPAKLQAGSTALDPALMHKLQSTLTPEDWQKAQAQADAARH